MDRNIMTYCIMYMMFMTIDQNVYTRYTVLFEQLMFALKVLILVELAPYVRRVMETIEW